VAAAVKGAVGLLVVCWIWLFFVVVSAYVASQTAAVDVGPAISRTWLALTMLPLYGLLAKHGLLYSLVTGHGASLSWLINCG
jgi:hypothetical protein